MSDFIVLHSTLSGKGTTEDKKKSIISLVEEATGLKDAAAEKCLAFAASKEELRAAVADMINRRVPKIAISGGDGFAALFCNAFFNERVAMNVHDYSPDMLFLAGGTGNAIAYGSKFKTRMEALAAFYANKYKTTKMSLLEVSLGAKKEISHFVSFGGDGEIIEIYKNQKMRGIYGYIMAVLKYAFSRKLYNPFSRNDANYNLKVVKNGEHIHQGRHEGGGISSIQHIGYGFRPYPLAVNGMAQIRFVIFGAILMPTIFKWTNWVFRKRNRFVYDHEVAVPSVIDFIFDRALLVQVSGDCDPTQKHSLVRVELSPDRVINVAAKA